MIQKIRCKIQGISPLLMHRFPMEPIEAFEKKTPEEQAEISAYRIPGKKNLYIPSTAIQRCFIGAGVYSKGKRGAGLGKLVASCVFVAPEYCDLGVSEFEVFSIPVVVPSTKGRIIRHRPKLNAWETEFDIDFEDSLLNEIQLRKIVDDAGQLCGLLDFNPLHKGSYGRFIVVKWDKYKVKAKK